MNDLSSEKDLADFLHRVSTAPVVRLVLDGQRVKYNDEIREYDEDTDRLLAQLHDHEHDFWRNTAGDLVCVCGQQKEAAK